MNVKRNFYYFSITTILIITALIGVPRVSAQFPIGPQIDVTTVDIKTKDGLVKVNLPDDMRAGDTISGTVVDERKNAKASDTLEGAVIDINGKQYKLRDKIFTFVVPAKSGSIPFILRNGKGEKIGRAQIPINQNPTLNFPTPRIGQTGRNLPIPGNFDGSAETTRVSIGGKLIPIIAESPRKAFVQIPADTPTGNTNIEIKENLSQQTQQINFNVISIKLTADKLDLQRGESTNLRIHLSGLEGFKGERVFVEVRNMTPSVEKLNLSGDWKPSGGDSFIIPITPVGNLRFNNAYEFSGTLTGVQPGGFTILATMWDDYLWSLAAEAASMTLEQLDAKLSELAQQMEAEGRDNGTDTAKYKELEDKFKVYKKERDSRSKKSPA